jgi:galactokinase
LNQQLISQVSSVFEEKFGGQPQLYFSPGRINIIGEHIDYNDGFVMPAAIDKGVYFAMAANNTSNQFNFYSIDFNEHFTADIHSLQPTNTWKNYVLSVVNQFIKAGVSVGGFDCVFAGDIPVGSGLSSSAAVEGGIAFGLNELFNNGAFSRQKMALLNQAAEHDYPNVKCGIMDQYANMNGRKNSVLLLDCKAVTHQYFPLQLAGYQIVLINTKVHHSLAESGYNNRRQICEEGLRIIEKASGISSFRAIKSVAELNSYQTLMSEQTFVKCTFVVEEILRTQEAAKLLQANDIAGLGQLMYQTHHGLSKKYEVSCPELDFLVELAAKNPSVLGARLMGGGFGGCTINIVATQAVDGFIAEALSSYHTQMGNKGEAYVVTTSDGTFKL